MDTITFDNLPEAVTRLHYQLNELKELILNQNKPQSDRWFDLLELCKYLPDKPAKATVYTWVRERRIPYHKKGKKLAFLQSEIDEWIKQGKQNTVLEIEAGATESLNRL